MLACDHRCSPRPSIVGLGASSSRSRLFRAQVSLVNLTMALGIAVEFCAHPVHAFMQARGDRPARTVAALRSAGAAVLSGIALTKLIGALSEPIDPARLQSLRASPGV